MTTSGRVLVVDSDYDVLDALATALRARGHQVSLAADGRLGLQSAVELAPEVVVVDRDVQVFDIRTFLDVLRDNPKTAHARMFVMGTGDVAHIASIDGRAEPLVKPFNATEVASRIDEIVRRKRAPAREPELKGDLSQVAIFDLLQVFAVNRRTGKLRVEGEGSAGEIWLRDGRIVDATQSHATGEKAFYRVLAHMTGKFVFVPGLEHDDARIHGSTEALLMEGARRTDEVARVKSELPDLSATVAVAPHVAIPSGLFSEIVLRLDEPRPIEELLDLVHDHDLEILMVVRDLLKRGQIEVRDVHARQPFCDPDELAAISAAVLRIRRGGAEGPARVGIFAPRPLDLARFARSLSTVREYLPSAEPPMFIGASSSGVIGTIRLGTTELELYALPCDSPYRPLWGALLGASTVVVHLGPDAIADDVTEALRDLDVRVVRSKAGFERPTGAVELLREALGAAAGRAYAAPR